MGDRWNTTLKMRFHEKVVIDHTTGCWLWTAAQDGHGYGQISVNGRPDKAHRLAYRIYMGEIPVGLCIDHLCRTRLCVNPEHLEPVTLAENTLRQQAAAGHYNALKSHCRNGHLLSGDNLRKNSKSRLCRTCLAMNNRRYRQRKARR